MALLFSLVFSLTLVSGGVWFWLTADSEAGRLALGGFMILMAVMVQVAVVETWAAVLFRDRRDV